MISIVTAANIRSFASEMEQAYRLRHQVFVTEMGWKDIERPDGREIDQFDDQHAVHMLATDRGEVLGYQRMLPTTRPYLLTEVLPQLCDGPAPRGPHIWEWTRYCVKQGHRDRGRMLSPIGSALLTGIVEWGLASGVDQIVIEMNPLWLLRLVQLHFRVTPLGIPQIVGTQETVAVTAAFDERTLERLRTVRGSEAPVIRDDVLTDRRLFG
ncbi:acyl-homoserine-lactone synthase [Methylobacterium sp. SyP6R]|uniref:acyl-homoserine-lactone synthase n=1 Tax=Methylobacterium sp. SyP6R TaxID=2718876 RepID=UPI001F2E25E0|nr:acyl-homoserine-lactone synthase [Methylobacterium sp. SyP6R]MCF4126496.1 GNAT family N-acetyltransferase [Methylobacterium sp. SyP6R]